MATAGAACALLAGCGGSTRDSSYFAMRAVTSRTSPPCVAPALGAASSRNLPVTACYALGPTALDAHDVNSAVVRPNTATQTVEVEVELTAAGVERFNALARAVGVGGQAAVLVDGAIVSVPRLDTTDFPGKAVITGLDLAAAQRLASRLNAPGCAARPSTTSRPSGTC